MFKLSEWIKELSTPQTVPPCTSESKSQLPEGLKTSEEIVKASDKILKANQDIPLELSTRKRELLQASSSSVANLTFLEVIQKMSPRMFEDEPECLEELKASPDVTPLPTRSGKRGRPKVRKPSQDVPLPTRGSKRGRPKERKANQEVPPSTSVGKRVIRPPAKYRDDEEEHQRKAVLATILGRPKHGLLSSVQALDPQLTAEIKKPKALGVKALKRGGRKRASISRRKRQTEHPNPYRRTSRNAADDAIRFVDIPINAYKPDLPSGRRGKGRVPSRDSTSLDSADELSDSADELSHSTDELSHSTDELSHSADELSHSADELSHSADELSYSTDELSASEDQLNEAYYALSRAVNDNRAGREPARGCSGGRGFQMAKMRSNRANPTPISGVKKRKNPERASTIREQGEAMKTKTPERASTVREQGKAMKTKTPERVSTVRQRGKEMKRKTPERKTPEKKTPEKKTGRSRKGPVWHLKSGYVSDDEIKKPLSDSPFFVQEMKHSNVTTCFWLTVPAEFAREHLPKREELIIVLQDKEGRKWDTKYLSRKGGISGGWRRFALDKKLQLEDIVFFHLLEPTKFLVKITRSSQLIIPNIGQSSGEATPATPASVPRSAGREAKTKLTTTAAGRKSVRKGSNTGAEEAVEKPKRGRPSTGRKSVRKSTGTSTRTETKEASPQVQPVRKSDRQKSAPKSREAEREETPVKAKPTRTSSGGKSAQKIPKVEREQAPAKAKTTRTSAGRFAKTTRTSAGRKSSLSGRKSSSTGRKTSSALHAALFSSPKAQPRATSAAAASPSEPAKKDPKVDRGIRRSWRHARSTAGGASPAQENDDELEILEPEAKAVVKRAKHIESYLKDRDALDQSKEEIKVQEMHFSYDRILGELKDVEEARGKEQEPSLDANVKRLSHIEMDLGVRQESIHVRVTNQMWAGKTPPPKSRKKQKCCQSSPLGKRFTAPVDASKTSDGKAGDVSPNTEGGTSMDGQQLAGDKEVPISAGDTSLDDLQLGGDRVEVPVPAGGMSMDDQQLGGNGDKVPVPAGATGIDELQLGGEGEEVPVPIAGQHSFVASSLDWLSLGNKKNVSSGITDVTKGGASEAHRELNGTLSGTSVSPIETGNVSAAPVPNCDGTVDAKVEDIGDGNGRGAPSSPGFES